MTTEQAIHIGQLGARSREDLISLAQELGVEDGALAVGRTKDEILHRIFQVYSELQGLTASGILESMPEGYGFLRQNALRPAAGDVYVSQSQIRRFALRTARQNRNVRPLGHKPTGS